MNTQYSVLEILKSIDQINETEKEIDKHPNTTFISNSKLNMEKKITKTQGSFGEDVETVEWVDDVNVEAQPLEIDEITKVEHKENDILPAFEIDKITKVEHKENDILPTTEKIISDAEKTLLPISKEEILILTDEIIKKTNLQETNKEDQNTVKISQLNKQIGELKENNNLLQNDLNQISQLNKQIDELKENNNLLQNDLNQISQAISKQENGDKEFQAKLEIIYKQQNIIKEYEKRISKLEEQNKKLEQQFELPPSWLTGDLQYSKVLKNEPDYSNDKLDEKKYNEEINIKSKIIYEQQNVVKNFQDQVLKLKEKNQLLQEKLDQQNNLDQISELEGLKEDNKITIEGMHDKIKFYQDDNLRLSNEVVKLTSKLENTTNQLSQFESNKAKLVSQIENLNNIVSENNVIGSPFDANKQKVENINTTKLEEPRIEVEPQIKNTEPKTPMLVENTFNNQKVENKKKISDFKELDIISKKIFK